MKKLLTFILVVFILSCSQEETVHEEDYSVCEPTIVEPDQAKLQDGFIEGDILPDIHREGLTKGAAIKDKLWPEGIIPYYFPDNEVWYVDGEKHTRFTGYEGEAKRDSVRKALDELSDETGLQFIEYNSRSELTSAHENGVYIKTHFQNSSHVGMQGGLQLINLSPIPEISVVKHELLHAAGILHEATRSDRDDHIIVHYDNIPETYHRQFDIYSNVFEGYDCGNFDFESIMLYESFRSYGIDSTKPVITSVDGRTWERNTKLSQGDTKTIQALYKNEFKKREL